MDIPEGIPWDLIKELPVQPIPPEGVTANFKSPDSNSVQVYIFSGICIPLVILFAGLRVYAKAKLKVTTTWIDYYYFFSLAAGFSYIGLTIFFYSGKTFGHHSWDIRLKWLSLTILRLSILLPSMISPIMWLVKLNLFLMFLQIFSSVVWLKILTYIGIVLSGVAYAASMISNMFFCVPRDGSSQMDYLRAIASPYCVNHLKPLAVIGAAVNIAIDFYILIIPLPAVWSLRIPLRQRLGVSAIFATGFLACIASILSLLYKIRLYDGNDNMWDSTPIHALVILEIAIGLIVPCMPTASKVMFKAFPAVTRTFTSGAQSRTTNTAASASASVMATPSSRRPSTAAVTPGAMSPRSNTNRPKTTMSQFAQLRSFDSTQLRSFDSAMSLAREKEAANNTLTPTPPFALTPHFGTTTTIISPSRPTTAGSRPLAVLNRERPGPHPPPLISQTIPKAQAADPDDSDADDEWPLRSPTVSHAGSIRSPVRRTGSSRPGTATGGAAPSATQGLPWPVVSGSPSVSGSRETSPRSSTWTAAAAVEEGRFF